MRAVARIFCRASLDVNLQIPNIRASELSRRFHAPQTDRRKFCGRYFFEAQYVVADCQRDEAIIRMARSR
jgi:hypothetical protein